jgi:hypothetical protein
MPWSCRSHSHVARMVSATTMIGPGTRGSQRFMARSATTQAIDMIKVAALASGTDVIADHSCCATRSSSMETPSNESS